MRLKLTKITIQENWLSLEWSIKDKNIYSYPSIIEDQLIIHKINFTTTTNEGMFDIAIGRVRKNGT